MSTLFDGATYDPDEDDERLSGQLLRIYDVVKDGDWRTLGEIEAATGEPQASISAQLRHLRKPKFGAHVVNKRPRGARKAGLYEYQVLPAGATALAAPAPARTRKNPFLAGVVFAARIVAKSSDMKSARTELARELKQLMGKS